MKCWNCCPSRVRYSRTLPTTLNGVTSARPCVYIYIYMYICVYTHTHTHTHIHTPKLIAENVLQFCFFPIIIFRGVFLCTTVWRRSFWGKMLWEFVGSQRGPSSCAVCLGWRPRGSWDACGAPVGESEGHAAVVRCACVLPYSQNNCDSSELCASCGVCIMLGGWIQLLTWKVAYCLYSGPERISEELFQTIDLLGPVYF